MSWDLTSRPSYFIIPIGVRDTIWRDTLLAAPATELIYDKYREAELSPRVKMAIRLYESGACKTKAQAADAAGLSRQHMYLMTSACVSNPRARALTEEIDGALTDRTIDMSKVLSLLGRRAVQNINTIMENSESEGLRLRAAQDLADRSPETSKTIKAAVAHVNITGEDAKELAAALVSSAKVSEKYAHLAEGDFVKVDVSKSVDNKQLTKGDECPTKISQDSQTT